MIVQQFFVKGLAHSSYMLGGTNTCAIIDPRRDIEIYLNAADSMDMEITHILETHLHADFISGHLELAEKTGARIYAPRSAGCRFDHIGLVEGDSFEIEGVVLNVLETPGHTPEHISYVVVDIERGKEPVSVFCGDTLFVGDVGRPDLFPGIALKLASSLYDSLHSKLLKLPDFCEVYPAHGAGSLCGRAMGAKRISTIGYERLYNRALMIEDREVFVKSLTTDMPPAPDHFSYCSAINRDGPALLHDLPVLEELEPKIFSRRAKQQNTVVLDIRSYDSFGGQHIPGAYHIDIGGNFSTFAGWILPQDSNVLLVTSGKKEAEDTKILLRRVGIDHVLGYLDGGMFEWANAGFPVSHTGQLSAEEFHKITVDKNAIVLIDVRAPSEYQKYHIEGAINIPVADLRIRYSELDPDALTILTCSTGHRSSLGISILKQHGFKNLLNLAGGMTGYGAAGYAPECPVCFIPHGPHFLGSSTK